jgi:hypothetical protein
MLRVGKNLNRIEYVFENTKTRTEPAESGRGTRMTDYADTQVAPEQDDHGVPTAGAQELTIPKWRFDEINAQLRSAREEAQIKDQLLKQVSAANQPQQQQQGPSLSADELGIDQHTFQAASKIAGAIAQQAINKEATQLKGYIAQMANDLEESKFLQRNPGKDQYLAKVKEYRARHYQMTGGYIDMDSAYKIIRHDELEKQALRQLQTQQGTPAHTQVQTQEAQTTYPNPAMTRTVYAPQGVPGARGFSEMSVEEMEARLEEQFRGGNAV